MRSSRLRDAIAIRNAAFELPGRESDTNGRVKDRITREIEADKGQVRWLASRRKCVLISAVAAGH
jgi:hypothetical protein